MQLNQQRVDTTFVTQSQFDNFRREMQQDFNKLRDCVTNLITEMTKTIYVQEELTRELKEITRIIKKIEIERIELKAKWKIFCYFKPIYQGVFKTVLLVIGFSITFHSGNDILNWVKYGFKSWLGF